MRCTLLPPSKISRKENLFSSLQRNYFKKKPIEIPRVPDDEISAMPFITLNSSLQSWKILETQDYGLDRGGGGGGGGRRRIHEPLITFRRCMFTKAMVNTLVSRNASRRRGRLQGQHWTRSFVIADLPCAQHLQKCRRQHCCGCHAANAAMHGPTCPVPPAVNSRVILVRWS